MAIPHYVWPDDGHELTTAETLEATTDAFEALSDPTRAVILATLFDADRRLRYTELAAAAGIEDKGRLNYHLRRLDDLLDRSADGYVLSEAGHELVDSVLSADTSAVE